MRQVARIDANQPEIVKALRQIGATVELLHRVGKGCPDLLVGYRGKNWLLEIKDGNKPPSERTLTPDQVTWHQTWQGTVQVVKSVDEALGTVGAVRKIK